MVHHSEVQQQPSRKILDFAAFEILSSGMLLCLCLAYSSALKTGVVSSSTISVNFYQATQHHIPEDSTLRDSEVVLCSSFYFHQSCQSLLAVCSASFVAHCYKTSYQQKTLNQLNRVCADMFTECHSFNTLSADLRYAVTDALWPLIFFP
jgi:hypothetical protein